MKRSRSASLTGCFVPHPHYRDITEADTFTCECWECSVSFIGSQLEQLEEHLFSHPWPALEGVSQCPLIDPSTNERCVFESPHQSKQVKHTLVHHFELQRLCSLCFNCPVACCMTPENLVNQPIKVRWLVDGKMTWRQAYVVAYDADKSKFCIRYSDKPTVKVEEDLQRLYWRLADDSFTNLHIPVGGK